MRCLSSAGGSSRAARWRKRDAFPPPSPPPPAPVDELCGVPTERRLGGRCRSLRLPSRGLGPAEAGLVGRLLGETPSLTGTLDLSWNAAIGADGGAALAKALEASASPVSTLDLSGCRLCDVDERGRSVVVRQEVYTGGAEGHIFDNELPHR